MKKPLKSTLCLLLCAALLMPALFAAGAQTNEPLNVFVASDIHYRPPEALVPMDENQALPGDELYHHANTKGMMTYEADAVIAEFLDRFEASDAQYLLVPGDLSENGHWVEHLGIAAKLRAFEQRSDKEIFVIPGNHDIRTSASGGRLNPEDFLEIYADLGYDLALARHEGSCSYTADLDDKYRLLALDACIYREDGGAVSPDLLNWIDLQVQQAERDGKYLLGMVHHGVLEHVGLAAIGGNLVCLENYRALATQFADWGIRYWLTGHEHANDISSAVSAAGNPVTDIETGCLLSYPNAYRDIEISDSAFTVTTGYIDSLDTSLLPPGFSPAQIEAMESDLPAYSLGYFRAGIQSAGYDIPDSTPEIADKLGIEPGTPEYTALGEVMNTLSQAVLLPMVDTAGTSEADSISEIAALAGVTIGANNYANVMDLGGDLFARHYAGDETTGYDSPEVLLLGQSLNAVLVYALMQTPVRAANALFEAMGLPAGGFQVSGAITTQAAKLAYMQSAAKVIMKEMVEPVFHGFINDHAAPGDLNVALEPYGETAPGGGTGVSITDIGFIFNILRTLWDAIVSAMRALMAA